MPGPDEWTDVLPVDTSGDVHVTNPAEDVYVFYTEEAEEFIRTDCVVDVSETR